MSSLFNSLRYVLVIRVFPLPTSPQIYVPNKLSLENTFLNENFFPSFAWPDLLGGGYHYMQLEGDFNTVFNGYATHTGATNGINFSFNKILPVTINRTNNIRNITINMEITNWYQNPTLLDFTTNGIMGDIISQEILQTNGIEDVFSIVN